MTPDALLQLHTLTDKADIAALLDRHLRSLDEGVFDEKWAEAFYTEDAIAEWPVGAAHGRDQVLATTRQGMSPFARTVHVGTNNVIEVDGDSATASGAQLSTHVLADGEESLFVSMGHADSELVRTPEGWRINRTALRIVWTAGKPPL